MAGRSSAFAIRFHPPNLDSKVCISSLLLSEKGVTSLCRRLINERRLIEMAFVPVNLYPILQV